jgi:hypothetical protein
MAAKFGLRTGGVNQCRSVHATLIQQGLWPADLRICNEIPIKFVANP